MADTLSTVRLDGTVDDTKGHRRNEKLMQVRRGTAFKGWSWAFTLAIPISFKAPLAVKLSICKAALRTRRRELSISARDRAMSAMTEPEGRDGLYSRRAEAMILTMLVEVLAKSLLCRVSDALQHQIQGSRGSTNGTHTVVNAARTQAALDDLQPHEPSYL